MNIYFDTEFTGLKKDTQLISIGLVSEDGKEFYAEIEDVQLDNVDDWIKENVLKNTIAYGDLELLDVVKSSENYYFGSKEEIKQQLTDWLSQFEDVQLVSDVCHYDMVLFIDIFGTSFDLPENVCPYCYDINSDIAHYENISMLQAFNYSREQFVETYGELPEVVSKHNALYDAYIIKEIFSVVY